MVLAVNPASSISSPARIVIATRESRLALWQAEHVRSLLQRLYPACSVELLGMTTRGDQILDRPLAKVGGKGLFVKELETTKLAAAPAKAGAAVGLHCDAGIGRLRSPPSRVQRSSVT